MRGIQKGWPDDMLTGGKNGSLSGMGMGKHSGWTVWWESHLLQSRMESWNPGMSKGFMAAILEMLYRRICIEDNIRFHIAF